jgi:molybdopterin-guanine dinucleotide biosynthesis protein A
MQTGLFGNVSGALLMGGDSKRMGRDKARLEWQGEAWSTRTARMLARLFAETLLVGGEPEPDAPGQRVPDRDGPACALRGLVGALDAATSERVVVVATDLPLLAEELLLALTAWPEDDIVVPSDDGGDHPLCAIYRRSVCLPIARAHLESGRLSLRELLGAVSTARVSLEDLGLGDLGAGLLTNVNTPDELARLENG